MSLIPQFLSRAFISLAWREKSNLHNMVGQHPTPVHLKATVPHHRQSIVYHIGSLSGKATILARGVGFNYLNRGDPRKEISARGFPLKSQDRTSAE